MERAVARRAAASAWVLTVMFVVGGCVTALVGVGSLLRADWSGALTMLGISTGIFAMLPWIWRSRRGPVDLLTGKDPAIEAAESRAMQAALEKYDRLLAEAGNSSLAAADR